MRLLLVLYLAGIPAWAAITLTSSPGYLGDVRSNGYDSKIALADLDLSQGDVVIAHGGNNYRSGSDFGPITAGYTEIYVDSTDGPAFGVWYKVMGAVPDDSFKAYGTGADQDVTAYLVYGLSGVDTSHVVDTLATASNGSSTNPDPAAIVTVTDSAWVIPCGVSAVVDYGTGTISGYSNNYSQSGDDVNDLSVAFTTKQVNTAGSEDPGAWSDWNDGVWRVATVAIRPATSAAATIAPGFFFR